MNLSVRSVLATLHAVAALLLSLPASADSYREWYRGAMRMSAMAQDRLCGKKIRTVDPRNENICNSGYQNRQAPATVSTRVERTYWTCNNAVLMGIREGLIFEQSLGDRALTDCIIRARENFNGCSKAVDSQIFGLASKLPNYTDKISKCEAKSLRNGQYAALEPFRRARFRIEDERAFSDCMKTEGLDTCRRQWDDDEREALRDLHAN